MPRTDFQQLLDAGAHFGHLKRKWNPNMQPYIFMEKNGIHIIDLQKTVVKIDEAAAALKQIAKSGRKILFVATKKQAKDIVSELVSSVKMPYVTERWPGGMLTNFPTIRKAVKKMVSIDKMTKDTSWEKLSKREKLQITRQRAKLEKVLGSIVDLTRLPSALFVIDVMKEKIAVREAQRLGIPVFGIVDTNSDPTGIDFVIPANDDASQSIQLITGVMVDAIREGLQERRVERDKEDVESDMEGGEEEMPRRRRTRKSVKKAEVIEEVDSEVPEEMEEIDEDAEVDLDQEDAGEEEDVDVDLDDEEDEEEEEEDN
ncbi:MAG: 30S ribosomal protein S2 [Prolixibacteraceae bacterium]|jgi:small subunit ribosomal protein S2|nr:30S ribosomal protein S2 [Prolixibacteraceae bacterium]MDI9563986.1 30S ribosomal protein S2 [Bacteroidota bacterium]NLS99162.1 30S ribosomal protein S2 [Bacteroidales bacterium]OQB82177.1 MAG: 30S ribosomal protein S2 [Bacteroidetes bacterium ADurb.Bin123]HNZ69973.1 30S ribosomal protein S2 [Prolixibacteraceae bacterium]